MRYIVSILAISLLLAGFTAGTALAQQVQVGAGAGLTPDSPFYFLDDLWDSFRLTFTFNAEKKAERRLKFAQEKLAEAEVMAQKKNEKALEKALSRYEEHIERAQKRVEQFKDERKARVAERVAEATSRHFEVLERVREKVPEQAQAALLRAREASEKGHLESIRALSERQPEKAAQFTARAIKNRLDLARKKIDIDADDDDAIREVGRFERFAEFAEELKARHRDGDAELKRRIESHLDEDTTQRDTTLRRVLNKVPEQAKPAIQRALKKSDRVKTPRDKDTVLREAEERKIERERKHEKRKDVACIQVITRARNPKTGKVRDFPTPCDVPKGWEILSSAEKIELNDVIGCASFEEIPGSDGLMRCVEFIFPLAEETDSTVEQKSDSTVEIKK